MLKLFRYLIILSITFLTGCKIELLYKTPLASSIEVSDQIDPVKIKVVDKRDKGKVWHVCIGPLSRRVEKNSLYWYNEESDSNVN